MSKDTRSTNDNRNDGTHPDGDVAPFERWLDKKLKNAYGSVLEEPIPQDIIDLLRKKLD
jgi:hypothetical protein